MTKNCKFSHIKKIATISDKHEIKSNINEIDGKYISELDNFLCSNIRNSILDFLILLGYK